VFRGFATYFLAQERMAADRRRSDELVALYRRPDALPDAPDARGESASVGGVAAGVSLLVRQLVNRVTPSPR
jgi:hypothetical protein